MAEKITSDVANSCEFIGSAGRKEMNMPLPEDMLDTFADLLYDTLTRNKCDFSQ